jgi:hypothetical protein
LWAWQGQQCQGSLRDDNIDPNLYDPIAAVGNGVTIPPNYGNANNPQGANNVPVVDGIVEFGYSRFFGNYVRSTDLDSSGLITVTLYCLRARSFISWTVYTITLTSSAFAAGRSGAVNVVADTFVTEGDFAVTANKVGDTITIQVPGGAFKQGPFIMQYKFNLVSGAYRLAANMAHASDC